MAYKGKTTCRILKDIRRQIAEANDIDLVIKECTYQGDCAGTCPRCEAEVAYLERELAKRRALGKAACITGIATSALLGVPAAAQTCATDSIAPVPNTLEDVEVVATNQIETVIFGAAPYNPARVHIKSLTRHRKYAYIVDIKSLTRHRKYAYIVDGKRVDAKDFVMPEHMPSPYVYHYPQELASVLYFDVPKDGVVFVETTDTMHIRGLVQDKRGEPVVGCYIVLRNNKKVSTITSDVGEFELKIPHAELASLEFVCMGYEKTTLPVEPLMLITLEDDSSAYETVTTGIVPDGTLYQESLINSPVHADSIPIKVAPKKNKK